VSGGVSGAGRFNNSTGLSVCWNLPSILLLLLSSRGLLAPLSCCIVCLTGQFLDIIFLVPLDALLYVPVSRRILLLRFYLSYSCSAHVSVDFFSFLFSILVLIRNTHIKYQITTVLQREEYHEEWRIQISKGGGALQKEPPPLQMAIK
jgi:hypothetical protein